MRNQIDISHYKQKDIYELGADFTGTNTEGEKISFTNYYMEKNGRPFFGVSGEFHFSRMDETYWEDELIKMKLGGINIVSTYVLWIHHEEEEGIFDFSGRRNLRKFVELCQKHGIYVVLRVGPFAHGEVRNGGLPDWLYGKPFDVRQLNEGFLHQTEKYYRRVGQETKGLYYQDGGPIIGTQIDNEYMHSSSPWENCTGISNEWVFAGNEGDAYMERLRDMAAECGIQPVFYTCTGWGGAPTPSSMMPLWGGYAFQPWLFYSYKGPHPSTQEYVYQDLHNNAIPSSYNFEPHYAPEERPYACCEMGGGMMCSYYYRFILPYKSVDAMANIKIASGCNFLGYYVYQGGSNPMGKHGTFLNEGQVEKISYDYQACLGEYGQVRESYLRLKTLHFFVERYAEQLCPLKTYLPEGASQIDPKDLDTLRFAVRTDGSRGFLFLNNYQDHEVMHEKQGETVTIQLPEETITFDRLGIATDENCILPFHFDLQGIDLIKATAQPITDRVIEGQPTYFFLCPDGMNSYFTFEEGVRIDGVNTQEYCVDLSLEMGSFTVEKGNTKIHIIYMNREKSNQLYFPALEDKTGEPAYLFSEEPVLVKKKELYQELWHSEEEIPVELQPVGENRYTITFPHDFMKGKKDAILKIDYMGDIGHAFIDGKMIHDNFCNHATWEIGLRTFAKALEEHPLTIYITPLKEGVNVNVESSMAARIENVAVKVGEITKVKVVPMYEKKMEKIDNF